MSYQNCEYYGWLGPLITIVQTLMKKSQKLENCDKAKTRWRKSEAEGPEQQEEGRHSDSLLNVL
jgi:hypothetical protein